MTNLEYLKSLPPEDFAKIFFSLAFYYCQSENPESCPRETFRNNLTPCEQCLLEYLNKPFIKPES
jgi:hypothetical protein